MSRQVYTYTDLREIAFCEYYQEIKDLPQIIATTDLRKAIQWYPYSNHGEVLFNSEVRDFGQLFEAINSEWKKPEVLFSQMVLISGILRKKMLSAETRTERDYYKGLKRNSGVIVKAINLLEEACVQPEVLLQANTHKKDIVCFCELWEELIKEDSAILELHRAFQKLRDPCVLKTKLREIFGVDIPNRIILHGFYYVSPLQERFFQILENSGYQLIFLLPYHKEYPTAMENCVTACSKNFGFDEIEKWKIAGASVTNQLGEIFEGNFEKSTLTKLRIQRYRNTVEFARAIKEDRDNAIAIYSPISAEANKILKEFYPEEFGERKLLSYPVGKFLIALHECWDEDDNAVKLDASLLREVFSSGWLSRQGISSRSFIRDLEALLPYFSDCKTLPQWRSRLIYLRNVMESAVEPFRKKSVGKNDARWLDVMGNPLAHFSMFSIEPDRLYDVVTLVEDIARITEELFSNTQETSIAQHMAVLSKLVKSGKEAADLLDKESAVIQELICAIDRLRSKNLSCDASDIVSAIRLYLSGDLSDEEHDNSGSVGMVNPLLQIDAATIKNGGRVHICMIDSDSMPGTQKGLFWPLDIEIIENCCDSCDNRLLDLIALNYKNAPVNNRYYMFSAFQNQEITLSWIEAIGEKKKAPSPYIAMLQGSDDGIFVKEKEYLSLETVSKVKKSPPLVSDFEIAKNLPKDVRMDYAVCPLRYLYGYVLDTRPCFMSLFQQSHAVGGLIQAILAVTKQERRSKVDVARHVFSLFPNLRQVEKQQILDFTNSLPLDKTIWDEYSEHIYPPARLSILYPNSLLKERAGEKYAELLSQIGRKGIDLYSPTDVKGACPYCPHVDFCRNAIPALDQEDYYA